MRVFLASDVEYCEEMNELYDILKKENSVKTVEKHNLHLTYHFYGETKKEDVEEIIKNMERIKHEKIECKLNGIGVFPSWNFIRVIWIGVNPVEKVIKLYEVLKSNLGFRENEKFVPHVTIGRVKNKLNQKCIAELLELNKTCWGKLTIDSVSLKESTLTKNGPIYREIKKVELS